MKLNPSHPRLLVCDSTWTDLAKRRLTSPILDHLLNRLETDAKALLGVAPAVYKREGIRLLSVSRMVFKRVVLWSFCHRLTGEMEFAARAEKEMLTVAAFSDWNPKHFLDTAEMTAAVALGYDWLYQVLPAKSRALLRAAIVEKGLKPAESLDHFWYAAEMNWNQVCLCGMALGALAIAEDEPQRMREVMDRVRRYNPNGLKPYAPSGVYPEGPSYWSYGTTYQVILLAALESALGTDWALDQSPGFLETAYYPMSVTGPNGKFFNYADNSEKVPVDPTLFWFARRLRQPGILFFQNTCLDRYLAKPSLNSAPRGSNRFLPLLPLWADDLGAARTPPERPLAWHGRGENPVAVFRSSWTQPDALFVALKGGAGSSSHGHMDVGSFILEADGVRWAIDINKQSYHELERKKIDLWQNRQESTRWSVFCLNNFSHNTLTINGKLHRVNGHGAMIRFSDQPGSAHAVLDLTPVFARQAQQVLRGCRVLPDRRVLIQDELAGLQPGDEVRWALVTRASVKAQGCRATLRQARKQLQLAMAVSEDAEFEVIPADPPKDNFNRPNPDLSILIIRLNAPRSGRLVLRVFLQPGKGPLDVEPGEEIPCEKWSEPLPAVSGKTP